MTKYKQEAKSGECRFIEHNPSHNHFISNCASRCQNLTVTDLQACTERLARRLQVSFQSTLRVSSSPVTESDVQNPVPLFVKFLFVLHRCGIGLVKTCTHTHTSFKKLPMGCISYRGLIVADLTKLRSVPRLFLCNKPNCVHN